jgi:hypothetical protein
MFSHKCSDTVTINRSYSPLVRFTLIVAVYWLSLYFLTKVALAFTSPGRKLVCVSLAPHIADRGPRMLSSGDGPRIGAGGSFYPGIPWRWL